MSVVSRPQQLAAFLDGADAEPHSWEGPFHLLLAIGTVGVVLLSLYGYAYWGLSVSLAQAMPLALILLFLAAVAAQYRWRCERKCFNVVMMVFWIVVVTNGHFFPMYMAGRVNASLVDPWLAQVDHRLGIEVPTVLAAIQPYPLLGRLLLAAYVTLIPLMTAAAVLPPLFDRMHAAKQFVLSCIIAATISLPLFAYMQAAGPWDYYGFAAPIPSLHQVGPILERLKNPEPFVIDLANRDGLITFPSFHVVLTVLAAAALWPFRLLAGPSSCGPG